MYDPSLRRWHVMDPLAEEQSQIFISPYHYCSNNPILYIDPDGKFNWKVTTVGLISTIGGIAEVSAGATIAGGTGGMAAPVGGFLVIDGMAKTALGVAKTLEGITMPSDKELTANGIKGGGLSHSKIPGGMGEITGSVIGMAIGGNESSAQSIGKNIGKGVDFVTGLASPNSSVIGKLGITVSSKTVTKVDKVIGALGDASIANSSFENTEDVAKEIVEVMNKVAPIEHPAGKLVREGLEDKNNR